MSSLSSNIKEKYYEHGTPMIPLQYISTLAWSAEMGERLKSLRGKKSRRSLSEDLKKLGYECSHQNIQRIEDGQAKAVPLDLILIICEVLGISLGELIPLTKIEYPKL